MNAFKQNRGFYKSALILMFPMILQNLVTNSMSMADTFMVGALGETELAAVTLANTPFFIVALMTFGLQSGTSILASQYYGRGDFNALNRILGIGLYTAAGITLLVGVFGVLFPRQIMHILTNNTLLIEPGAEYCRWVAFAYFFDSLSQIYIGLQRSMENTKLGMYVLVGSGLLNIFLNWCLIFGKLGFPAWGIKGAAIATTISRIVQLVIVIIFALRTSGFRLNPSYLLHPGRIIAKDFVKFALPVVINETLWSTVQSIYTVIMGHMEGSTQILSAYTVSGNVDRVISVGLFAMGGAASIIIGRDIGSKCSSETVYHEAKGLNIMSIAIGLSTTCLVLLVRGTIARPLLFPLMEMGDEAVEICMYMLLITAAAQPIRCFTMTDIVGIFRAGGDSIFAALADLLPSYLVALPAVAMTGLWFGCSIQIVYPLMILDEFIKMFLVLWRFPSGKWINNITRETL